MNSSRAQLTGLAASKKSENTQAKWEASKKELSMREEEDNNTNNNTNNNNNNNNNNNMSNNNNNNNNNDDDDDINGNVTTTQHKLNCCKKNQSNFARRQKSNSSDSLSSSSGSETLDCSSSSHSRSSLLHTMAVVSSGVVDKNRCHSNGGSSTSGAEDNCSPSPLTSPSQSPSPDNLGANSIDFKQLNANSNLIPETSEANRAVDLIRLKFIANLTKQSIDLYEQSDLDELRRELPPPQKQEQSLAFRLISRFVQNEHSESGQIGDKELADYVEKLAEFLQMRRQYQLPHIRPDEFFQEMYLLHGVFPFGYDRQHLPVLYLRANVHRRWSHKLDESFRRYVMWQIDIMTKSYAGAKVQKAIGLNEIEKDGSFGICFDCIHVSYACVDMDFLRFIVKLLVHCYPTYCRYALCVDLPWLFRSVWKLVRSWLPEDAQNTVQLITAKQLNQFIDERQIPNSFRISDNHEQTISEHRSHKIPENFSSIRAVDEFAKDLALSSSELKSFKSHVAKVVKEYQKMGALPESIEAVNY